MNTREARVHVVAMLLIILEFVTACAPLHHRHDQETAPDNDRQSTPLHRQSLHLNASAQEGLSLTMREHLEALQNILAALARKDYEQEAAIAHEELGFPKHHQALQREQGFPFPPAYQKLAMAHHRAAEELAQVIPSKDTARIFEHLYRTVKACVNCHQTYKL
ncbi:hypothetical protein D6833_04695 [Candidatus Parcubacteria bacterium]|nr:MAG: hypothetical protein D6833_04695 [Candidatus Parcubacteria bacterium]